MTGGTGGRTSAGPRTWPAFVLVFWYVFGLHVEIINSTTHWVVSENGKIQPQVNSIFDMKKPYDLVGFLEQEKRVEQLESLKELLADTTSLDSVAERHEPDLEDRFYNNDLDCQKAGQPLTEFDLFASTLIHPDPIVIPEILKILRDEFSHLKHHEMPFCTNAQPLHFELDVIDELSSTVRRDVLDMAPEVGLLSNVLEHNRFSLSQYGHLIADSMHNEPKYNWLGTYLASNYWRISGRPKEAIDCLRKAIFYAPIQFKHYGLLSLANIFHRSHNSHDAVAALDLALKYTPENPAIHFTLGNVQATIMQFNQSIKSYSNAIKIHPQFTQAKQRKHAVLCHYKLEKALEDQHKALEATLEELRQYKKQHEEWSVLLNKIMAEQASIESRLESRLQYEEFKRLQNKNNKGKITRASKHATKVNMAATKVYIFSQMTEHKINMMEEHKTEIFKLIKTSGTISNVTVHARWQYENYMIRIAKTLMINPNLSKNGEPYINNGCSEDILPPELVSMIFNDFQRQNCVQHRDKGKTFVTCSLPSDDAHKEFWRQIDNSVVENGGDIKNVDIGGLLKQFEHSIDSLLATENIEVQYNGHSTYSISAKVHHQTMKIITEEPSLPAKYIEWPENPNKESCPFLTDGWPTAVDCAAQASKKPQINEYPTVFLSPENKGFDIQRLMSKAIGIPVEYPTPLPWLPPTCKSYDGKTKYDKLPTIEKWTHISVRKAEREIESEYYKYSSEKNFHEWGARVHGAMDRNIEPKWVINVLAGTYWRIFGHPQNGIHCFRWALSTVPHEFEDVVLTNLAGLLYKTGAIDEAITLMKDSLAINNKDPDSNFFMGNLYSAKGNYSGALFHYKQALHMKPDYHAAFQFMHVPACEMKFKMTKKKVTSEQIDRHKINGMESMVFCKDGHCRTVSPEEFLANTFSKEALIVEESLAARSSQKKNKKSKKNRNNKKSNKNKKNNKVEAEPPLNLEDMLPKEGENTVLLDKTQTKRALPLGAVEIGTIAETEPDDEDLETLLEDEDDEDSNGSGDLQLLDQEDLVNVKNINEGFIGPINLVDDPIPDVMIKVREKKDTPPPNSDQCKDIKEVNWNAFTSSWLSTSAKNIDIREYLGDYLEPLPENLKRKPYCEEVSTSLLSMDHLVGIRMRKHLHVASEAGLREAFQGLIGEERPMDEMATRIAIEMEKNSTSWVLSTAAALYWRVKGQASEAVQCLRHSLYYAPREMKDIPLVSLANILHRAGLYNDALIVTNMALEISPQVVVTHFTMANIFVSKNELDMAVSFYLTTLALQSTFEPANDRLKAIYCNHSDKLKHGVAFKINEEL